MYDRGEKSEFFVQQSRLDFSNAYQKGFWRSILTWLRKKNNELLPYEEVLKHIPMRGQNYIGVRQIETDNIIGSVSRYHDFDRAFLPRQTHTRSRWESIDRAHFKQIILPPIEVYKIGDAYFIKDGNHRVSVAREKGQAYIDAYVTEVHTPGHLDKDTDLNQLVLEQEYLGFLKETNLDKLYPDVDFRFTLPGQYDKVLQHISVHRWFMGEKLNRPISDEESIKGWYKEVFQPLRRIIEKHNILQNFPHRTPMDLYLWILEHRWYLAEEQKRRVSLESAALHYTNQFSRRPFRHIRQSWQWLLRRIRKIKKQTRR
jgi:hypothetical protein